MMEEFEIDRDMDVSEHDYEIAEGDANQSNDKHKVLLWNI